VSSDVTTGVMSDSFFNLSGGFPVAVFDLLTASRASQFSWLLLLPFVFILLLLLFLPISSLPMLVRLVLSLGFVVLLAIYRVSVVSFQVMPFVVTIFDLLYALALFLSSLSALVFLYYFFAKKSLDKNTSVYLFFLQLCLILFCLITALS
jgi:hypothetical protein